MDQLKISIFWEKKIRFLKKKISKIEIFFSKKNRKFELAEIFFSSIRPAEPHQMAEIFYSCNTSKSQISQFLACFRSFKRVNESKNAKIAIWGGVPGA